MWGIMSGKGEYVHAKKAKEMSALTVSKIKTEGRYAVGGADGLHFCVVGNSRCWTLRIAVGTKTNGKGKTIVHRTFVDRYLRSSTPLTNWKLRINPFCGKILGK